jgi:glycosyltransferase involved in cell wall biosynthesis
MSKVSMLIPSRNEIFLTKTIEDILNKASGDIEIIVNIDENWPERLIDDKRVKYLHPETPQGMRAGINSCVKASTGEYLMKVDGHCMFAEGFDEVLKADMQDNWIVIPGRHSLDPETWTIAQNGKSRRDYHYLCYPDPLKDHDLGIHGVEWPEMSRRKANDHQYDIDNTMSFQGSAWFMKRTWFTDFLKGMNEHGYGTFSQEPQEIGMKTWLGGGEVKVNKKTYYCHLHKGKTYGRMYHQNKGEIVTGHNYSAWYWATNQWPDRIHDIDWFIDKFWPVPTWPEDYRAKIDAFWIPFGKEQGFV